MLTTNIWTGWKSSRAVVRSPVFNGWFDRWHHNSSFAFSLYSEQQLYDLLDPSLMADAEQLCWQPSSPPEPKKDAAEIVRIKCEGFQQWRFCAVRRKRGLVWKSTLCAKSRPGSVSERFTCSICSNSLRFGSMKWEFNLQNAAERSDNG